MSVLSPQSIHLPVIKQQRQKRFRFEYLAAGGSLMSITTRMTTPPNQRVARPGGKAKTETLTIDDLAAVVRALTGDSAKRSKARLVEGGHLFVPGPLGGGEVAPLE